GVVGDTDHDGGPHVLVPGLDGHHAVVHDAVGDDDAAAVEGAHDRLAQVDAHDRSADVPDRDLVTAAEGFADQEDDAGEEVAEHLLERDTGSDGDDAHATEDVHGPHAGEGDGQTGAEADQGEQP